MSGNGKMKIVKYFLSLFRRKPIPCVVELINEHKKEGSVKILNNGDCLLDLGAITIHIPKGLF